MQQTGLVSGNYLFSFGGWMEQTASEGEIFTQIHLNGSPISGSEMKFKRGRTGGQSSDTQGTHNYANFPINNVPANATIEIRWRVDTGLGTITNRYFTIFKI